MGSSYRRLIFPASCSQVFWLDFFAGVVLSTRVVLNIQLASLSVVQIVCVVPPCHVIQE